MRKINFCLLLLIMTVMVLPAQSGQAQTQEEKDQNKPRKFNVEVAYAYKKESKVVNESDFHCTHFFRDGQSEDIKINGSEQMEWGKIDYSDGDRMFIDKGSNDGINEDGLFLILGKGDKKRNPFTGKKLGTFYLRKSIAKIVCLYEDKAVIELMNGCHPVQIGDFAIPFQEREPIMERKLDYKRCKLPESEVEARVVYTNIYTGAERDLVSEGQYVTVDQGNAMLDVADWVLFYKIIKKNLPPVIVGTGIVVDAQNTSSTVKVIESAFPVELGVWIAKLDKPEYTSTVSNDDIQTASSGEEQMPLQQFKDEGGDVLDINILFDIDQTDVKDRYKKELERIKPFIQDKSQYVITLRGYSCSIGGFEHNLKLSKQRVDTVKKYLMDNLNIQEKLIEAFHYGEKDAPFDNSSEAQRRKNRLVSVEVRGR